MIAFIQSIRTSPWPRRVAGGAVAIMMSASLCGAQTQATSLPIAILEFDYLDTSGEVRDQSATHARCWSGLHARCAMIFERVSDMWWLGSRAIRTRARSPGPIHRTLAAARQAGAKFLLFGGIHKMSTLVQWAKVQVVDVDDG